MRGHLQVVALLVGQRANLEAQDADVKTPLHMCSEFGHADVLTLILQERPLLNLRNKNGNTAVDVSINEEILLIFADFVRRVMKGPK